jgi:uncharacterized protein YdaU (DUF1376 family)
MGRLKWYKRDANAALAGMMGLTLEERGAYNTILDLIYARDGILPDDDLEIARMVECDPRKWRLLKRRLIDRGKLFVSHGRLHNARADIEISDATSRMHNERCTAARPSHPRDSLIADIPNGIINQPLSGDTSTTRIDIEPPVAPPYEGGKPTPSSKPNGEEIHERRTRRPRKRTLDEIFANVDELYRRQEEREKAGRSDSEEDH